MSAGTNARTQDANRKPGSPWQTVPLAPLNQKDAPNEELRQAWEYYHTPRAECKTAPGYALMRSLNQIITYDAYHKAEAFLTQPLLVVAGDKAGSKWMSDDLFARAASTDKKFHIVEGSNHMCLYDGKSYIDDALSALGPFFMEKLQTKA